MSMPSAVASIIALIHIFLALLLVLGKVSRAPSGRESRGVGLTGIRATGHE